MTKRLHGIIHGKTIELEEHPGLREGEEVEVQVRVAVRPAGAGEGIRRSAGVLAPSVEDDHILAEIADERRRARIREVRG